MLRRAVFRTESLAVASWPSSWLCCAMRHCSTSSQSPVPPPPPPPPSAPPPPPAPSLPSKRPRAPKGAFDLSSPAQSHSQFPAVSSEKPASKVDADSSSVPASISDASAASSSPAQTQPSSSPSSSSAPLPSSSAQVAAGKLRKSAAFGASGSSSVGAPTASAVYFSSSPTAATTVPVSSLAKMKLISREIKASKSGAAAPRLRTMASNSSALTPAAARAAAANLNIIREAAARARARRERIRPPQPDYTTGEHVKGLWGIYLRFLHERAVLAVFLTSVVLWAIGDCVSQAIEHRLRATNIDEAVKEVEQEEQEEISFKWGRFFGALVDGSLIAGVGGYYWYSFLDKFVTQTCALRKGTAAFLGTKMLLEFVVWHPLNLITFWMVVGFAEGDGPRDILRQLQDDFFATLLGEYALWGPLDVFNFAFVPVHLQVILCNFGALLESIFLSFVRSQGFPGFPQPAADSLEDRSQPISIVDVMRATDVPFSQALRDGAQQWKLLDPDDDGSVTAAGILQFLGNFKTLEEFEEEGASPERLLPGIPSVRATEACAGLLIKHAAAKGCITRREYLRFIGELNHAAYRQSALPEVAFTLFDSTERHMITGSNFISLAQLLFDTPEARATLQLMMPALEALRSKELTVDEASSVLHGIDTLSRFQRGEVTAQQKQHLLPLLPKKKEDENNNGGGGGWWNSVLVALWLRSDNAAVAAPPALAAAAVPKEVEPVKAGPMS